MRHILTSFLLTSVVLLGVTVCCAQEKDPENSGTKVAASDMWEAYKNMWEGNWETRITFPVSLPSGPQKGDTFTATMSNELIASGHGMLITRCIRNVNGDVVMEQKGLASWCPKRKVIILCEVNTDGGRGENVIEVVDAKEHVSATFVDASGDESSMKSTTSAPDVDSRTIRILDGPMADFEIVYKRKNS